MDIAATKSTHITSNLYALVCINCDDWRFDEIWGNCIGIDPNTRDRL